MGKSVSTYFLLNILRDWSILIFDKYFTWKILLQHLDGSRSGEAGGRNNRAYERGRRLGVPAKRSSHANMVTYARREVGDGNVLSYMKITLFNIFIHDAHIHGVAHSTPQLPCVYLCGAATAVIHEEHPRGFAAVLHMRRERATLRLAGKSKAFLVCIFIRNQLCPHCHCN